MLVTFDIELNHLHLLASHRLPNITLTFDLLKNRVSRLHFLSVRAFFQVVDEEKKTMRLESVLLGIREYKPSEEMRTATTATKRLRYFMAMLLDEFGLALVAIAGMTTDSGSDVRCFGVKEHKLINPFSFREWCVVHGCSGP